MKARKMKYNLRNLLKQNKSYIENIFCWNYFSISKEISSFFRWHNFTASTRTGFGIDPSTFQTLFVCFSILKWYIYGYLLQNTRGESKTIEEARLFTPTTLKRGSIPLTSKLVAWMLLAIPVVLARSKTLQQNMYKPQSAYSSAIAYWSDVEIFCPLFLPKENHNTWLEEQKGWNRTLSLSWGNWRKRKDRDLKG